ncbi:MAG: LysM peptidoglycan-binding domain-containing protein [Paludibacter sp.]
MSFIKNYIFILLLIFSSQSILSQEHTTIQSDSLPDQPAKYTQLYTPNISLIDSIINFSKSYLGSPYRGGHDGPNSFDCSGFTSFVFRNFGIKLGRSSSDQADQVPTVSNEDIAPGDLVFFNGHRRGSRVGHVGMVVSKHENGNFDFIHSASSVGISISNSEADYYTRRFIKAGRVIQLDTLMARSGNTTQATRSKNHQNAAIENDTTTVNKVPATVTTIVKKTIPAKYHIVKSGETLSEIADKYGMSISQLKKKNKLKKDFLALKQRLIIKDEQHIEVVQKVRQTPIKEKVTTSTPIEIAATTDKDESSQLPTYHSVQKGETLFSISKKYAVSIDDLKELNKLKSGSIFKGQRLLISQQTVTENIQTEKAQTKTFETSATEKIESAKTEHKITSESKLLKNGIHIVSKGETLQSISKQYGIKIAELKELNNMTTDNIQAGQKLITPSDNTNKLVSAKKKTKTHTVKSGETLSEIAEKYNCKVSDLKKWNNKSSNKLSLGEKLKIMY